MLEEQKKLYCGAVEIPDVYERGGPSLVMVGRFRTAKGSLDRASCGFFVIQFHTNSRKVFNLIYFDNLIREVRREKRRYPGNSTSSAHES